MLDEVKKKTYDPWESRKILEHHALLRKSLRNTETCSKLIFNEAAKNSHLKTSKIFSYVVEYPWRWLLSNRNIVGVEIYLTQLKINE